MAIEATTRRRERVALVADAGRANLRMDEGEMIAIPAPDPRQNHDAEQREDGEPGDA